MSPERTHRRQRRAGAAALLGLCALCLLAGCSGAIRPSSPEQALARGDAAHARAAHSAAIAAWQAGLEQAERLADPGLAGRLALRLAAAHERRGEYPTALHQAAVAQRQAELAGDAVLLAEALIARGLAQRRLGEYRPALASLQAARATLPPRAPLRLQSDLERNLGATHQALGDLDAAGAHLERALQLARAAADNAAAAMALNNLGGLQRTLADYPAALRYYRESLALRRQIGDTLGQARVLGNLCLANLNLGDLQAAESHCREALELAARHGYAPEQANQHNNLAAIALRRGDPGSALRAFRRSLAIKQRIGDSDGEARTLNNIGLVLLRQSRTAQARDEFERALAIQRRLDDLPGQADTLYNLGRAALAGDDRGLAWSAFADALAIEQAIGRRETLWRLHAGISRLQHSQGNRGAAIFHGKQAVAQIQAIRLGLGSLDARLRRSFLDDKLAVYEALADLLIEAGRLLEAQQVLGLIKDEEYFDFVRGDTGPTEPQALFHGDERLLASRYDTLGAELQAVYVEYRELKRQLRSASEPDPAGQARLAELRQQREALRARHAAFIAELERYYEVQEGTAVDFSADRLQEIETLADEVAEAAPGVLILHFFPRQDDLAIMLTDPYSDTPSVWQYSAKVAAADLDAEINDFRSVLTDPTADPLPLARRFHHYMLEPVQQALEMFEPSTLLVYLGGNLRYVPLAALHDGQGFVGERYGLVLYSNAAKGRLARAPAARWRIAGFGITEADQAAGLGALPAVAEELDVLIRDSDQDTRGLYPGRAFLDDAVTAEQLRWALDFDCGEDCFEVAHFATHFVFRPGTWESSALLIGGHQQLSLEALGQADISFRRLDLLTLSACDTALSWRDGKGREIEGLATLAQKRGAKSVLATLWKVADVSTAVLMEQFYRHRLQSGDTKAAALRAAQTALIRGRPLESALAPTATRGALPVGENGTLATIWRSQAEAPYSHPYYWAPFVLMGNWR